MIFISRRDGISHKEAEFALAARCVARTPPT